jgi:hypothetical protein
VSAIFVEQRLQAMNHLETAPLPADREDRIVPRDPNIVSGGLVQLLLEPIVPQLCHLRVTRARGLHERNINSIDKSGEHSCVDHDQLDRVGAKLVLGTINLNATVPHLSLGLRPIEQMVMEQLRESPSRMVPRELDLSLDIAIIVVIPGDGVPGKIDQGWVIVHLQRLRGEGWRGNSTSSKVDWYLDSTSCSVTPVL